MLPYSGHADLGLSKAVPRCERAHIRVARLGEDMMWTQDPSEGGDGHHHLVHSNLQHGRGQEDMPIEAYTLGHQAHVRCVEEDWSTQKSLHRVLNLLDCRCASLSGVGAFQNIDQGGSLLPLKIVDDVDHVEKEPEAGVVHSLAIAGSADALTLLVGTQHIDGTMSFH